MQTYNMLNKNSIVTFQQRILKWYSRHKRDDLPWRYTNNRHVSAYEILVSEIMLQQTQVSRVLDMFPKFIHAFPSIKHLANAQLEKILNQWQGMGYNRRALYLQQCAEQILNKYNSIIPSDVALLTTLPGIGPYTAGAVSCFAFNKPSIFLDTNIRKFFIHHFFTDGHGLDKKISDKDILPIAEQLLYQKNPRIWNYALMDYGALKLSHKPDLLSAVKKYHKQSQFLGSNRFFRSRIVQYILKHQQATFADLQKSSPYDISPILASLQKEGLLEQTPSHQYRVRTK